MLVKRLLLSYCLAFTCLVEFGFCQLGEKDLVLDLSEQNPGNCDEKNPKENCMPKVLPRGPTCLHKRKILGLQDEQDEFVIVEAFIGQDVKLECHYCNEKDEDSAKLWYYNDRLFKSAPREIPQHLELPLEQRKFNVDENHMLIIRNFSESEGAIYFCQGLRDNSSKFNFLIDVVPSNAGPEPNSGDAKEFEKYYKETVKPVNKALAKEYSIEVSEWLKLKSDGKFDITYEWSPWGGCSSCGRDSGSKRRHGKCRLIIPMPQNEGNQTERNKGPRKRMKFGIQFSCQSLLLDRFLSVPLVNRIRKLTDFVENSKCKGTCLVDLHIEDHEWKENAQEKPLVAVNILKETEDSLTLTCPSTDLESQVAWVKDGTFISAKILQKLSRRQLTLKNELQFQELRLDDTGNYTCFIENSPSYSYTLYVTQKVEIIKDVSWVWKGMGIFSTICFIIWLFLICVLSRTARKIQSGYKPLTQDEERDTRAYLSV